jgi:hypothetical protein
MFDETFRWREFWGVLDANRRRSHRGAAQLADEKVDLIKLYAGLSDLEVAAISTEAKKYKLRTILDAHSHNGSIQLMARGDRWLGASPNSEAVR